MLTKNRQTQNSNTETTLILCGYSRELANYTAHDPLIFNCDGFRRDGEGTQEKDLLDHGGDLEQFREFQLKATASADNKR